MQLLSVFILKVQIMTTKYQNQALASGLKKSLTFLMIQYVTYFLKQYNKI